MKKISILFLSFIALLFLSVYLAPSAYASELNAQYPFNLTVVFGEDPETGTETPSFGNLNYGTLTEISIGDLNGSPIVNDKEFAFYVISGEIVADPGHQFRVTSNTKVTAVFTDETEIAAVFVDTNGNFVAVDYLASPGTPVAPSVAGLSKPGYITLPFGELNSISEHTVFVVQYEPENPDHVVTINGEEYPYNSVVTLHAEDGDFTHWEENGVVVSYNHEYSFSALEDRTIEEKTNGDAPTSFVTLSDDLGFRAGEGKASYLGQFELHGAETFIEAGIIGSSVYVNNLTLDTPDIDIIASNAIHPTTNEFLRSIDLEEFAVVRGYLVTSAGTYYSENQYVEFNEGLKIWEVYGAGGNSGATYNRDFLVIKNTSSKTINLDNYYITYFSATGTGGANTKLNDYDLAAGEYYVITFASGANGVDLPVIINQTYASINAGAANFVFVLSYGSQATATFSYAQNYKVVDLVGAGTSSFFEGSGTASAPSTTTSAKRNSNVDSNNNATDFTTGAFNLSYLPAPATFTVSFESNGGTSVADIENINEGASITKPADPTRAGYIFDKWYTNPELDTEYNFSSQVLNDFTLYAGWFVARTVTFDTDGGTVINPVTVIHGQPVAQPSPNPQKLGHTFEGWFEDDEYQVPYIFSTPVTSNITIYALFEESDGPVEVLLHAINFENGTNNNTYPGHRDITLSGIPQLHFYKGNVVNTGTPLTGTFNAMFRIPAANSDETELYFTNNLNDVSITNIKFNANMAYHSGSTTGSLKIYYRLAEGGWVLFETFNPTPTKTSYEVTFTDISGIVNIKFGFVYASAVSANRDSRIDDIEIWGYDLSE